MAPPHMYAWHRGLAHAHRGLFTEGGGQRELVSHKNTCTLTSNLDDLLFSYKLLNSLTWLCMEHAHMQSFM